MSYKPSPRPAHNPRGGEFASPRQSVNPPPRPYHCDVGRLASGVDLAIHAVTVAGFGITLIVMGVGALEVPPAGVTLIVTGAIITGVGGGAIGYASASELGDSECFNY